MHNIILQELAMFGCRCTLSNDMFKIAKEKFGSFDYYKLINERTAEYLSVIPAFGGLCHAWEVNTSIGIFQLFENYKTIEELTELVDRSYKGAKLVPYPNRVAGRKYRFNGSAYELEQCKIGEPNSIHGFLVRQPMKLIDQYITEASASITLEYIHEGLTQGYPFPFRLSICYELHEAQGLTISTNVTNTGDHTMPFGDGWHPYFKAPDGIDDLELQFGARSILETAGAGIPTGIAHEYSNFNECGPIGTTELDDCFVLEHNEVTLVYSKQGLRLDFWQEMGPGKYNYLQIYTPDDRKSIAIEPMTCEPNAFNSGNGLITINPDKTISLKHGIIPTVP